MLGFRSMMMYGGGYGYDDFGVDRSSWSDKSDAALRRERRADGLFDDFLKECGELDANDKSAFPVTKEVVGANCHLTSACYTSFRKRVMEKGCKVKRREATPAERSIQDAASFMSFRLFVQFIQPKLPMPRLKLN